MGYNVILGVTVSQNRRALRSRFQTENVWRASTKLQSLTQAFRIQISIAHLLAFPF